MANNNEMVLLPVNEPTFGTKRCGWDGGCNAAGRGVGQGSGAGAACSACAGRQPLSHPLTPALRCSKSQIQTFLEQNEGPGLQHMALKTDDIIGTLRLIRAR